MIRFFSRGLFTMFVPGSGFEVYPNAVNRFHIELTASIILVSVDVLTLI